MSDTVQTAEYFKVQVPNKPGEGARYLRALEKANVDLLAFLGFPTKKRAQMDFVPAEPAAFKALAKRAKWKIKGSKTCLLVQGQDRVGAVAEHANILAKAKVNIHAISALCGGAGRYGVILWVKPKDVKKAAKALGAG